MTAQVIPVMEVPVAAAQGGRAGLLRIFLSTLWVYFLPRRAGRLWLGVSQRHASIIAAVNVIAGAGWGFFMVLSGYLWNTASLHVRGEKWHWSAVGNAAHMLTSYWMMGFGNMAFMDKVALVMAVILFLGAAFLIPFFVLLPFAARPGSNKACLRHVARLVFLAYGAVHYWGAGVTLTFLGLILTPRVIQDESLRCISPLLFVGSGLALWQLWGLITASRFDYRTAVDMPQPRDPWCDDCGYNLIAADMEGRCPECGRPVRDSLSAESRPPIPWEVRPNLSNVHAIVGQIQLLVTHPRMLFFSMPTLTGQRAAQRWLVFSMVVIGAFAGMIVPVIAISRGGDVSWDWVSGGLAMGLVWAILAVMMVGIETAGIATFSRMRGHPGGGVYLGAAAKVTAYSSTLMIAWVFLGGIQLVGLIHFFFNYQLPASWSLRMQQVVLALSLAAAHIGGLLWYELTVYRGIRAIQFANK